MGRAVAVSGCMARRPGACTASSATRARRRAARVSWASPTAPTRSASARSTAGGATFAGYFNGTTVVNGAFAVTGSKSAAVKDAAGEYRLMYCGGEPGGVVRGLSAPARWRTGRRTVKLDPQFAQHIHTDDYHVFLTEHGENNALHVASQDGAGIHGAGG